jgi:predicted amidophosphoribosyltransferase
MRQKNSTFKRNLDEINKLRLQCGLPLIKGKDRMCLRCGKKFHSYGERICESCSRINNALDTGSLREC